MQDIIPYSDLANDKIYDYTNEGVVKMLLEQIKLRDAMIAELQESAIEATVELEEFQGRQK